nr:uncharacterized protein LOC118683857 [Bactrocera oleae]
MGQKRRGQGPQNEVKQEFLTQDLVAVQATNDEGADFVVAAAYFPGETPIAPPEAIGNLVEHCRRNKLPLIMGCDANAHHIEWGSTDCNTRVIRQRFVNSRALILTSPQQSLATYAVCITTLKHLF